MRIHHTPTHLTAVLVLSLLGGPVGLAGQAVLSAFEGSTELGRYSAAFDRLAYVRSLEGEAQVQTVEGALLSRAFEKPDGRSNLEVFRSYERELTAGGFDIVFASSLTSPMSFKVKQMYDPPHTPSFRQRVYAKPDGSGRMSALDLAFITGVADHYLVASRVAGGEERCCCRARVRTTWSRN